MTFREIYSLILNLAFYKWEVHEHYTIFKQVAVLQLLNSVNDFWISAISDLLDIFWIGHEVCKLLTSTNLSWYIDSKKTDVFIKKFLVE